MAVTSPVSAEELASSYTLFNAPSIKQHIITQLTSGTDPVFKDSDRLGANINAVIDIMAVACQQILFNYNLNTAETGFNTAVLRESMIKLVSILNYKSIGKQTSMLPVRFQIEIPDDIDLRDKKQFTIPKFLTVNYNSNYVLKNEMVVPINGASRQLWVENILFQGSVQESPVYTALGDEFELFTLIDNYINTGSTQFISDNFFTIYVDENNDGNWIEYKEIVNMFEAKETERVYEKRFTEKSNYEFKFGNGINGMKLPAGARVVIYYIISDGEDAQIGSNIVQSMVPTLFTSALYSEIDAVAHTNSMININDISYITISNTGPTTDISYPETVDSMRANAPRIFSSQNRLFSLADYSTFIRKNFTTLCRDVYTMKNEEYTGTYLKYYHELNADAVQKDSRVLMAQVEFMTATNFNNVYAVIVPAVNTIISGITPNYLNTTIKQEIVEAARPYQGLTHNLVILDPIYKSCTFGSYALDDDYYNEDQLKNTLTLVRNRLTKYSYTYIKEECVTAITNYFNNIELGDPVNLAYLSQQILAVPGVKDFYITDVNGHVEDVLTLYMWNPLYKDEDNTVIQQTTACDPFVFNYFYDIDNLSNLVLIEDEK